MNKVNEIIFSWRAADAFWEKIFIFKSAKFALILDR